MGSTATVDLTVLEVREFVPQGALEKVVLSPPLYLTPTRLGSLLVVGDRWFNISVWGETREELESALYSDLSVLWRQYAQAEDKALDGPARELKRRWLERAR